MKTWLYAGSTSQIGQSFAVSGVRHISVQALQPSDQ